MFIALFALLLFGPARLPELARGLAKAYREFQRIRSHMSDAVDELKADIDFDLDDDAKGPGRAPEIRQPAGMRISAGGEQHASAAEPLIELEVPDEDDYLAPDRLNVGEESE